MSASYHGKLIKYPTKGGDIKADMKNFRMSLPLRRRFLDKDLTKGINEDISKQLPILFMPNSIHEMNKSDNYRMEYRLLLFGILRDGSKACVVLTGIKPFFDIRIPDNITPEDFKKELGPIFEDKSHKMYPERTEVVQMYPFKYFQEQPSNYLRVYFYTAHSRKSAIEYFLNNDFEYCRDGQLFSVRLETASNDKTCYYRKVAREYGFKLCDWSQISNYEVINDGSYAKKISVTNTFRLDVQNFKDAKAVGIDFQSNPIKYRDYIRDKTMVMAWDLETHSKDNDGNAPSIDKVFYEDGAESDTIFMDSCNFSWYQEVKPFLTVCITTLPTPPRDDCMIILCKSQLEIIMSKCMLMEKMSPDIVTEFNGGLYDWPFIINRVTAYTNRSSKGLLNFLRQSLSCVPYTAADEQYTQIGPKSEKIKVEAGIDMPCTFFNAPGFVCLDVRNAFRQLYPNSEQSSLNFFLSVNKLGSKEDMPYQTMFKIYRISQILSEYFKVTDYESICDALQKIIERDGENYKLFQDFPTRYTSSKMTDTECTNVYIEPRSWIGWYLEKCNELRFKDLTCSDILELMKKSTDVAHYCNVDARLCHDLLRVRNVIADRRETANLSFTSMYDALYRAGGMKMRNLCIFEGIKPQWNLAFSCISNSVKDDRKYPGAFVVPPKKGLYRDHKMVKRRRRKAFYRGTNHTENLTCAESFSCTEVEPIYGHGSGSPLPGSSSMASLLMAENFDEKYKPDEVGNDQNSQNDRPNGGLDFASLYPSIIMAYNYSPEKAITDEKIVKSLEGRLDKYGNPYRVVYVSFRYGLKDQPDEDKELVTGWFVQHTPVGNEYVGMGLYPFVLKTLFDIRAGVKKKMEYYSDPKEFLEKFFETYEKSDLAKLSGEEQKILLKDFIDQDMKVRVDTYEKNKKTFYKWKIAALEKTKSFLQKEFFDENSENKTCIANTVLELYEECLFFFNYYNSKQLGLKIFMNTAYGETGNSLSPFFIKQVAGGVTTYGQKNLKFVKQYVEGLGWDVKYGDTDSLYVSPPEVCFEEVDHLYESGKITKLEYWTGMVEITMEQLDNILGQVAALLQKDNGTRFLKMAYEEVLFPYAFVGKKKYIGIQHQGIVNFSPCMPTCSLKGFMESKLLFIRGLEIKKRGSSQLLKTICYEVIKEMFCIDSVKTMRQIVDCKLKELKSRSFPREIFLKSARYRLPGFNYIKNKPSPGNVTVLGFVRRMKEIEAKHPEAGILSPEVGERFSYVVCKKFPWTYNMRGCKKNISVHEKWEYIDSLENDTYKNIIGEDIEIDVDSYISNELAGQFARFITYHPNYDQFYAIENIDQMSVAEMDEAYKAADKKAHGLAKKELRQFYITRYATKYEDRGKKYKSLFRGINKLFHEALVEKYGNEFTVLLPIDTFITNNDLKKDGADIELKTLIQVKAEKLAVTATKNYRSKFSNGVQDPFMLFKKYVSGEEALCPRKISMCRFTIKKNLMTINKILPDFIKVCEVHVAILSSVISTIKTNFPETDITEIDDEYLVEQINDALDIMPEEQVASAVDIITKMQVIYDRIIKDNISIIQLKKTMQTITYQKNAKGDNTVIPPTINRTDMKRDFSEWLKQKKEESLHTIPTH